MRQHTRLLVLDGTSSFLGANWTGSGAVQDLLDDIPAALIPLRVCDLYSEHGWDYSFLRAHLPEPVVTYVSSFSFSFCAAPDRLIWEPSSSGLFTVASAYQVIRCRRPPRPLLKLIWGTKIPVRVSIFFWRFLNDLLPFPDILQNFGFQLPSKCPCCEHIDTLTHFFFDCRVATDVWRFFSHFSSDLLVCHSLSAVLQCCLGSGQPEFLQLLPLYVIWGLWRLRNAILFEGIPASAGWVQQLVMDFYSTITFSYPLMLNQDQALYLQGIPYIRFRTRHRLVTPISWFPPTFPSFKLNVDGSSLGNPGPAGGGFVLRDFSGRVLAAQAVFFGMGTSLFAELRSLLAGLLFCRLNGYDHVCVESDSQLLVRMLSSDAMWPWKHYHVLWELQDILRAHRFTLFHIYREANAVADALAKLASSTRQDFAFTSATLSPSLRGLVALDRVSYPYIRLS